EQGAQPDPLAGAVVHDLVVLTLREVVAVLNRDDRHDLPRPLDLVDAGLGDADVPDLAVVTVLPDRGEALLERRLGVDPMEVVERDSFGSQAAKALFGLFPGDRR